MDDRMPPAAQDRVLELLRDETHHRTVAGLAHSADVSTSTVRVVLTRLEAEGKLDIRRDLWPNSYLLQSGE